MSSTDFGFAIKHIVLLRADYDVLPRVVRLVTIFVPNENVRLKESISKLLKGLEFVNEYGYDSRITAFNTRTGKGEPQIAGVG